MFEMQLFLQQYNEKERIQHLITNYVLITIFLFILCCWKANYYITSVFRNDICRCHFEKLINDAAFQNGMQELFL